MAQGIPDFPREGGNPRDGDLGRTVAVLGMGSMAQIRTGAVLLCEEPLEHGDICPVSIATPGKQLPGLHSPWVEMVLLLTHTRDLVVPRCSSWPCV